VDLYYLSGRGNVMRISLFNTSTHPVPIGFFVMTLDC
jgi:hypothetical protein